MTWQGLGAAIAGAVAQYAGPATAITVLAAVSVAVTVLSRPFVPVGGCGKGRQTGSRM
jgi:membrane protein implicated in regulation of membrane protease activity